MIQTLHAEAGVGVEEEGVEVDNINIISIAVEDMEAVVVEDIMEEREW